MWCALIPHTYQPRLWHAAGCSPLQGFERPLCLATALVSLWICGVIILKVLVIGQDLQRGRRHCIACSRGYHLIRRSQPPLAGELAKKERWCHLLAESLRGAVRECVGGEGKLRLRKKKQQIWVTLVTWRWMHHYSLKGQQFPYYTPLKAWLLLVGSFWSHSVEASSFSPGSYIDFCSQ